MKKQMTIIATAFIAVFVMVFGAIVVMGDPGRPPWVGVDGIIDTSLLPPTQEVMDRTGAVVGTIKTADDQADVYPLPVYNDDDEVIGYMGEKGFWALGEPEPTSDDSVTTVEEFDADGNLTHTRTINGAGEITHSWTLEVPGK